MCGVVEPCGYRSSGMERFNVLQAYNEANERTTGGIGPYCTNLHNDCFSNLPLEIKGGYSAHSLTLKGIDIFGSLGRK